MADKDKVATYNVRVDSNAKQAGKEGAEGLDDLRKSIERSQGSIRNLQADQRNLRGKTEEVTKAKEALKSKIDAERNAISQAQLKIHDMGASYGELTEQAKKAANEQRKLTEQAKNAKAPFADIVHGAEEIGAKFTSLGGIVTTLATIELAAVTVTIALAAAIASVTSRISSWITENANALRSMALLREVSSGSAENAKALGNQIEALGRKVPTSREELNKLGSDVVRSLQSTRVSGQGMVDTFNAVGQASAGMGDEAGRALRDIVQRSARFGRVQLNPFDFGDLKRSTGIGPEDIIKQLAAQTHKSIGQVQADLYLGRTDVNKFAAALRAAAEVRFGDINARKLLDLDVITKKFHDNLTALTGGVNIDAILRPLARMADLFSQSTVTGQQLKGLVTVIGNTLGPNLEKAYPVVRKTFLLLEIGALKIATEFVKLGHAVDKAFGGKVDGMALAEKAIRGMAGAVILLLKGLEALVAIAGKVNDAWTKIPKGIRDGLVAGITGGASDVFNAAADLAEQAGGGMNAGLEVHSPSKVTQRTGEMAAEGLAQGLEGGAGRVASASSTLASSAAPTAAGLGGGGGAAGGRSFVVNINVTTRGDGSNARQIARELSSPDFLSALTKAIEDAATGAAIPTQQVATP